MKAKILLIALAYCATAAANEALDLLEGKITEDEVTIATNEESAAKVEAEAEASPVVDDRDYSERWMNTLPPTFTVYDNANNPALQRVAVDGLVEWGYTTGSIKPDTGASVDVDDNKLRRARLGGILRTYGNTDVEARIVADDDGYQGVDTLKATVAVNEGLSVELGKFRAPFGQEYRRDPALRMAPSLSPIVENIAPANTLGFRFETYSGPWTTGLGYFSGENDKNIPGIGGNGFIVANIAYRFSPEAHAPEDGEEAAVPPGHQRWHLDYIHNLDDAANGSIPRGYKHLVSTGIEVSSGKFDFAGDFLLANGPVDTMWGMSLMGRYWLYEDAVRFVGRYSYADSDDLGAIRVGYGVPSAIGDSTQPLAGYSLLRAADEVHSFYGGLDWHIYGQNILLSTGLEYRLLKDQAAGDADSWLWHSGARVAF